MDNNVSSITIAATNNHNAATVSGAGVKSLSVGLNTFEVVVTAEDGTQKTYTVAVNRAGKDASNDATLSNLTVSTGVLSPEFSSTLRATQ